MNLVFAICKSRNNDTWQNEWGSERLKSKSGQIASSWFHSNLHVSHFIAKLLLYSTDGYNWSYLANTRDALGATTFYTAYNNYPFRCRYIIWGR